jgi:hypothetical protein
MVTWAWHGMERQGKERQGKEMQGKESKGKARLGKKGKERQGKAKHNSLTSKKNHKIQGHHNNHKMKTKFQSFINLKYLLKFSFYIHMVIQIDH